MTHGPILGAGHNCGKGGIETTGFAPQNTIENNITEGVKAEFDYDNMLLIWAYEGKIPECEAVEGLTTDMFGNMRDVNKVLPGPFTEMPGPEPIRFNMEFPKNK